MHLGHLSLLRRLKKFQEAGHTAVVVLGDFTASIGDPTGRSQARKSLSKTTLKTNADALEAQIRDFLHSENLEIHRNSRWLADFPTLNLMQFASWIGTNTLVARRDFSLRLAKGDRVGLNELLYPLFQAIDSIELNIDVELGGIDQKVNFALTRTLQKRLNAKKQVSVLFPLLPNAKGEKMSKSKSGCLSLNLPTQKLRDKLISIRDESRFEFARILLDLELSPNGDPKQQKIEVANRILDLLN